MYNLMVRNLVKFLVLSLIVLFASTTSAQLVSPNRIFIQHSAELHVKNKASDKLEDIDVEEGKQLKVHGVSCLYSTRLLDKSKLVLRLECTKPKASGPIIVGTVCSLEDVGGDTAYTVLSFDTKLYNFTAVLQCDVSHLEKS